jgi:hypothetical protein
MAPQGGLLIQGCCQQVGVGLLPWDMADTRPHHPATVVLSIAQALRASKVLWHCNGIHMRMLRVWVLRFAHLGRMPIICRGLL